MTSIALAMVVVACGYLYAPLLIDWFRFLSTDPTYSYGLLVVPLACFVAYRIGRDVGWGVLKSEIAPDVRGYWLLILAFAMSAVGTMAAVLFVARLSFVVAIVGVVVAGAGLRLARRFAFPLGYLLFAVPLPAIVYLPLSTRLQTISSMLAGWGLDVAGVAALREGNLIILPTTQLEVVQACSGVNELFAMLAIATLGGYLMFKRFTPRLLFALIAIPIAVLLNGMRITAIATISSIYGIEAAEGFAHFATGEIVFAVGCIAMLAIASRVTTTSSRAPATSGVRVDIATAHAPASRGILNIGLAIALVGIAFALRANVRFDEPVALRQELALFPDQIGEWRGVDVPITDAAMQSLNADGVLLRKYSAKSSPVPVSLYVAYYRRQQEGSSMHSPLHCIPGAGWETRQSTLVAVPVGVGGQKTTLANQLTFQHGDSQILVVYWYLEQGRPEHSELSGALATLWHAAKDQRTDGCLIRFSAPIVGSKEATLQAEFDFISQAFPILADNFLPSSTQPSDRRLVRF